MWPLRKLIETSSESNIRQLRWIKLCDHLYTMNSVTTYLCGAGEGQLVDIHVTGDSPSCSGAIPWDDVNYTGRESSLQKKIKLKF